jgi:hypothetical protein
MVAAATHAPKVRIQYLGFKSDADAREYRYVVVAAEGQCEFRFRIMHSAFAGSKVLIQDGPDLCYQQLLRELATGDNMQDTTRTVHASDLRAYKDAHTPVARGAAAHS